MWDEGSTAELPLLLSHPRGIRAFTVGSNVIIGQLEALAVEHGLTDLGRCKASVRFLVQRSCDNIVAKLEQISGGEAGQDASFLVGVLPFSRCGENLVKSGIPCGDVRCS